MNKISQNIPNMIKQPAQCCINCGKSYKKKINLEKHVILCEFLNTNKKRSMNEMRYDDDDEDDIPSNKKLYKILLELGSKFNKLEEKVDEINKWVIKKKKKINVIEWLNANVTPEIRFNNLNESIIMEDDDINYLFKNNFADTLNYIFSRNIYNITENKYPYPIFAFVQKPNVFYSYENEEVKWIELSKDNLIKFLNKIHMKICRIFSQYKKNNRDNIYDDESFSLLCDKTSVKIMNVDFRQDSILGKIRANMFSRMKTDMKAILEYEFEF